MLPKPSLNAKHKHLGTTGNEWLSRDPAVATAFADDPLTFYAAAIKLFGLRDTLRLLAAASDDYGVVAVEFYRVDPGGTTLLGSDAAPPWLWAMVPNEFQVLP